MMGIAPADSEQNLTTVERAAAMLAEVRALQRSGLRVGLVPTMGSLHRGHLRLVEVARGQCDRVVTTIFVNPLQFDDPGDLEAYPRQMEEDREKLIAAGCDYLFAPSEAEMFPPGFATSVDVGPVAQPWEGEHRPGHFGGVATIVLKLLQVVPASQVFFGEKDYQQTLVVGQLVRDLSLPVQMQVVPTVREPDGLALSSRNARLSHNARQQATALWGVIRDLREAIHQGTREASQLYRLAEQTFAERGVTDVDYVALVQDQTVLPVESVEHPTRVLLAATVGGVRLIDNALVTSSG